MILPKDGIKLHRGNINAITQHLHPLLNDGQCFRLQIKPWREKRSLSQNSLLHMWLAEISEYLIKSGALTLPQSGLSATSKRPISAAKR